MASNNTGFTREKRESKPVVAICYDFDKTLSPDDMQAQGYIQENFEGSIKEFWERSNTLGNNNDMDQNLAYMYVMKEVARGKTLFTKKTLEEYGSRVQLYPGVETWFDRINAIGEAAGVIVEHYIISSGLKEMIEGTVPGRTGAFKKIYASSFYFDEAGVAVWPAQVINYTNKTQFLFRIEKGVLDINDTAVNAYFSPDELRVPFSNMVYIGDSATDVPCMKLVNSNGGHSIGVYDPEKQDKSKVFTMISENRIKYFAPANYSEGSELETLLRQIIDWVAKNNALNQRHFECVNTVLGENDGQPISEEEKKKTDKISALRTSSNFRNTHSVVRDLEEYAEFADKEKEELILIAIENAQVRYILKDEDILAFYERILDGYQSENANRLREQIELM